MHPELQVLSDKLKAGEITLDEFIAENNKLLEKTQNAPKSRIKKQTLGAHIIEHYHSNGDARVLIDTCALVVKYAENQTGYKAKPENLELQVNSLNFEAVLEGFAALKKGAMFPTKSSRTKVAYKDKELTVNEYIVEYLLNLEVPTVPIDDDQF